MDADFGRLFIRKTRMKRLQTLTSTWSCERLSKNWTSSNEDEGTISNLIFPELVV